METETETVQVTETTDSLARAAPRLDSPEHKPRAQGFKGRAKGGRMGRGGRGGRGMMMKGFGPPGRGRGRGSDGTANGFGPMRGGMGRVRPYPDMHYRRGGRYGPMGMGPPMPPPMPLRGPHPSIHRPPPPPLGHPGFRGRPPHPRGRGMPPGPPRQFHPRGYHNGPAPLPPHPPPGRGQRWPAPPGVRRF